MKFSSFNAIASGRRAEHFGVFGALLKGASAVL